METIKNLFVDSLNGFAISQLPLFLFQILCAALLGFLLQFVLRRKWKDESFENFPLIAAAVAVLASIVKYSLPFSVLGAAALLLLLKKNSDNTKVVLAQVLLLIAAIGCGVGSIFQTVVGFVVIVFIILFTPEKKSDA